MVTNAREHLKRRASALQPYALKVDSECANVSHSLSTSCCAVACACIAALLL